MLRRALPGALIAVLVMALGYTAPSAAPVRLARYPDYHSGKVAFTYLGDIWIANEDGTGGRRLTDNVAPDTFPRFSPDGRLVAFTSERYGNGDVYVVPAAGGTPRRLTFHSGNDEVVGWSRDSERVLFRSSRGDGAFPTVATLYEVSVNGGQEVALPVDWGFWGAYAPDGKSLVFNRHPSVWSRQHYRGSYAADLWIADLAGKTYRQLLPDERYNRFWPMWGADDAIYFVADPLPNDRNVEPGSPAIRRSVRNIYRIPAAGGEPVQVTKHTDGNLFFPSMSADGKVIVYEENFGLWKLDVGTGRTSEITLDLTADEKENEITVEEVSDEVDSFDISPSGRRAIVSARGQLVTIATDRGDIRRVAPDRMASRNQEPRWSPDGRLIAFISDRSGQDEVWLVDAEGTGLRKVSTLDNEKGSLVWTPDSSSLLYVAGNKALNRFTVADGRTATVSSTDIGRLGAVAVSPDGRWVSFSKQDATFRTHIYIAPIAGGEERHLSDDSLIYSETDAVWTADGRYIAFTSREATSSGIASTGGVSATTALWAVSLGDRDRDPADRDIDSEAEALAAQAAGRAAGGRGGAAGAAGAGEPPVEVQIDWNGLARRARQLTIPGTAVGGLVAAPEGPVVAVTVSSGAAGGRGGGADPSAGTYVINVETDQSSRLPPAAATGGRGRGGFGGRGGGGGMVFAPDGRTLYFRTGAGLFAAPVSAPGGGGTGSGRSGRSAGAAESGSGGGGGATARQVTWSANIEVDRRALRAQVFNEGWRIMKNRFYDPDMHGADWSQAREVYEPLLDSLVDTGDLHDIMMMMIGQLNASHTGVSGGPPDAERSPAETRYPGFELEPDASGYYKVGHVYEDGPADHDYLKIEPGHFVITIDGHELRTSENYWQYFTLAAGAKFHFTLNDQPTAEGAWDLTIEPLASGPMGDLRYAKWVDDRRAMVDRLGGGEIGYLHIRAMNAPSLRQFQLDLAANRTKKALIIDQRFNGGGGIDQELLGILSGREYQYTIGRDAGYEQPRPQNFYGPMVVMQNERSASDAEMFPAGFKALGLGKTVGVPTMGAVIGTGSYGLLDGSSIRTPGSGVWTKTGQNMENYGVPPDVYVDNTPADFVSGRDAQIEKAVEVLKAEIATNAGASTPRR